MKHHTSLRSLLLLVGLAVSCSLSSCNKVKEALNINFLLKTADIDFTLQPTTQTTFSTTASKTSTLQAELDKNKAIVSKVTVKSVQFDLQPGSGSGTNNLGLLASGTASISVNGQTAKLGDFTNPATNTQSITVPIQNSEDLKQYLQASQFTVLLSGTTRGAITQPMNIKATISFDVTGSPK